jgi:pilus assembly protein CpaB
MQRQQGQARVRSGILLVASLLFAAVAGLIVFRILQRNQKMLEEARKPTATVAVVVATHDLIIGRQILAEDVTLKQLSPDAIPADQAETFHTMADIVGRTPRERVLAEEPLRKDRLARAEAGVGLNAIVNLGKRAMTIPTTDAEDALAGLVQPGNKVDIIVTIKPEDPTSVGAKWVAETILEKITVLAVGSLLDREEQAKQAEAASQPKARRASSQEPTRRMKPSITLEVTPEEAEKLALAQAQGQIHVVLRSDIDALVAASPGVTSDRDLIGYPAPVAKPEVKALKVEAPALPQAEVIQGNAKTKVTFESNGTTSESNAKKGGRNR